MSENITWREVCEEVDRVIVQDIADNNLDLTDEDSWRDYAHEWADSSSWVIYYHNSRTLWADSVEVRDMEDEANTEDNGIDARITACVYFAVVECIIATVQEYANNLELGE